MGEKRESPPEDGSVETSESKRPRLDPTPASEEEASPPTPSETDQSQTNGESASPVAPPSATLEVANKEPENTSPEQSSLDKENKPEGGVTIRSKVLT